MRFPGDRETGRTVRLPLIDIIEPANPPLVIHSFTNPGGEIGILVSFVFIRRRRPKYHVCGGRLAHARIHKLGDIGYVGDVPRVEERICCTRGVFSEAEHGLLRGDESTGDIDVHVLVESCQGDVEGVISRRGSREGTGCTIPLATYSDPA